MYRIDFYFPPLIGQRHADGVTRFSASALAQYRQNKALLPDAHPSVCHGLLRELPRQQAETDCVQRPDGLHSDAPWKRTSAEPEVPAPHVDGVRVACGARPLGPQAVVRLRGALRLNGLCTGRIRQDARPTM